PSTFAGFHLAHLLAFDLGRPEQGLEVYNDWLGRRLSTSYGGGDWDILLALGRIEEARETSRKLKGYSERSASLIIPLAAGQWELADSLGTVRLANVSLSSSDRELGGIVAAGARCARGSVTRGRAALQETVSIPDLPSPDREQALKLW